MANSFPNISYESKLSKVADSIMKWAMNVLKKLDTAQIISESCDISRRQEPAPALN